MLSPDFWEALDLRYKEGNESTLFHTLPYGAVYDTTCGQAYLLRVRTWLL